jgi:hypothetical protein
MSDGRLLPDVDFHWTAASGSKNKALRVAALSDTEQQAALEGIPLEPAEVPTPQFAMVSFATKMNRPWEGPPQGKVLDGGEYHGTEDVSWTVDCGGYQLLKEQAVYDFSIDEYLEYISANSEYIDRVVLRDWACEPDLIEGQERSVTDHQQWSLADHIAMVKGIDDRGLDVEPMAVVQGYTKEQYLSHLDSLAEHGLIFDSVGIGSVCARDDVAEIAGVVDAVATALPDRCAIHGFGMKVTALANEQIRAELESVDTAAWDYRLHTDATTEAHDGPRYHDEWFDYRKPEYPSANWRNTLLAMVGYAGRITELCDEATDTVACSLSQFGSENNRVQVRECLCGATIDPSSPEPVPDSACRHCQRWATSNAFRHIDRRDRFSPAASQPGVGGADQTEDQEPASRTDATEQSTLRIHG